jgi:cytidylate kinase
MAIITISRGSYSHGKEIAEKVAEILGYECVSREILLEASQYFKVSEKKLLESIHNAPSLLDRITHGREKYIAYIRAALLDHVKKDNVVYHGHAGHLLIPEVPHVLKVRVIAEMDERIAFVRKQRNMSRDEAAAFLANEDRQRTLWTRYLYKVDIEDPRVYDIILNIGGLRIIDACTIICDAAKSGTFTTTVEAQKSLSDLAIVSHVKAALKDVCEAEVKSTNGMVHIQVPAQRIRSTGFASPRLQRHVRETIQDDLTKEIVQIVQNVPGVKEVFCDVKRPYYS